MRMASLKQIFILMAVPFAILACKGGSKSDGGTRSGSGTPSNQLVFNNGAEPEYLDPHRMTALNDALLAFQMFEGLTSRDKDFVTLKPGLAESWETKDGKRFVFTIRPDLKWSNGEPMTIEQIRGSFIRAMDPDVANQYLQWYTDYIVGAKDFVDNFKKPTRAEFEKKLGIKILAPNKLEITLFKPAVFFLQFLSQQSFFVVHPSMYDTKAPGWNDPAKYITCGPYKLKEWTVNKRVVLEKNPYYHDAAMVSIPEIVALPINDENTVLNLYESKEIDWTGDNHLATTVLPSLRKRPDWQQSVGAGTYTYIFNVKKKPFDNPKVRRALSLSIERSEIVDKVAKGGQMPTYKYVPPIMGYSPKVDEPKTFEDSVKEAQKLLADAGYPGGNGFPTVTILYNTTEGHHKIAQTIQQMWKKNLGINVNLQNREWKVFLQDQQNKDFEISRQSWIGDIPDPGNFLDIYITHSGNNHTNWGNKEFDKIIDETASMRDQKKRMAELERAEEIFLNDQPVVPIYHYTFFSLLSPRVQGFTTNMFGIYQFKFMKKT